MMAIMGRLVHSAKLDLVLAGMVLVGMVLKIKFDGCALVSMRRLEGSIDVYLIVSV